MSGLLRVDNLRVRFRAKSGLRALVERDPDPFIDAVRDVSFFVERGETLALIGESGCGKTTLARAIMGLVPAQSGSILFRGDEMRGGSRARFARLRREAAIVLQDPVGSLSPRMRIAEIIAEPLNIWKIDVDPMAEAARLLRLVGLPDYFATRYPHQLSGGQARRVGVARALAASPRLLVADEPTAGLDVSVQGEILNLLVELQRKTGIGILLITHNLGVARHVSDYVAIMYLGRIVERGATAEIFAAPRHPYTRALLSAAPNPPGAAPAPRVSLRGETPGLLRRPSGCEFHPRCPFAREKCRAEFPPLARENARDYACHYPLDDAR